VSDITDALHDDPGTLTVKSLDGGLNKSNVGVGATSTIRVKRDKANASLAFSVSIGTRSWIW
jgi:hypothetical protein